MAKNIIDRLDNGAVFEVPLLGNKGFSYVKLHKFHTMENGGDVLTHIFRVIDFYSETSIGNDISFLEEKDYTFVPLILLGIPRVRGKLAWKFKGYLSLKPLDNVIPKFSFTMKHSALLGYNGRTIEDVQWSIISNISMIGNNSVPATHEQVKGLGFYIWSASIVFSIRLTLFWNRQLDLKFDLDELIEEEGLTKVADIQYWNALIEFEDPR